MPPSDIPVMYRRVSHFGPGIKEIQSLDDVLSRVPRLGDVKDRLSPGKVMLDMIDVTSISESCQ